MYNHKDIKMFAYAYEPVSVDLVRRKLCHVACHWTPANCRVCEHQLAWGMQHCMVYRFLRQHHGVYIFRQHHSVLIWADDCLAQLGVSLDILGCLPSISVTYITHTGCPLINGCLCVGVSLILEWSIHYDQLPSSLFSKITRKSLYNSKITITKNIVKIFIISSAIFSMLKTINEYI